MKNTKKFDGNELVCPCFATHQQTFVCEDGTYVVVPIQTMLEALQLLNFDAKKKTKYFHLIKPSIRAKGSSYRDEERHAQIKKQFDYWIDLHARKDYPLPFEYFLEDVGDGNLDEITGDIE